MFPEDSKDLENGKKLLNNLKKIRERLRKIFSLLIFLDICKNFVVYYVGSCVDTKLSVDCVSDDISILQASLEL